MGDVCAHIVLVSIKFIINTYCHRIFLVKANYSKLYHIYTLHACISYFFASSLFTGGGLLVGNEGSQPQLCAQASRRQPTANRRVFSLVREVSSFYLTHHIPILGKVILPPGEVRELASLLDLAGANNIRFSMKVLRFSNGLAVYQGGLILCPRKLGKVF